MPIAEIEKLLTPKETAEILSTTEKTLSGWRNRGVGPKYVKSGVGARRSSVRYRKSDLESYMKSLTSEYQG